MPAASEHGLYHIVELLEAIEREELPNVETVILKA